MTRKTVPLRRSFILAFASVPILASSGCGSPPSVVPVLRIVESALEQEASRVQSVDAARDQQFFASTRRDLEAAYRADLNETSSLTPDWIESATLVYVTAREQLLRQELQRAAQRDTRAENLRTASAAQSRAISILEQQDRLLQRFGVDLWRMTPPSPELLP